MKYVWRRCQKTLTGEQSKFCGENCKNSYFVARRGKALKAKAVVYKGGKRTRCDYNRCVEALTFHHVAGKDFGIAFKGYPRSWTKVQKELDACILLCSNCHAEIHAEQNSAAPSGNEWVNNQVNSGNPKDFIVKDKGILSQARG